MSEHFSGKRTREEREAYWAEQTPEALLRMRVEESRDESDPLLRICLSFAVPLWIDEVKTWPSAEREAKARAASHLIAYGPGAAFVATAGERRPTSKQQGQAGEVFNAIACGLALLAYCPGGVTFAGNHWEAKAE